MTYILKKGDKTELFGNLKTALESIGITESKEYQRIWRRLKKGNSIQVGDCEIMQQEIIRGKKRRSELFICSQCGKQTIEWLNGMCEDCTLESFTGK